MTLAAPLGLLLLSAPFGLFLAVRHLRQKEAPLGPALAHGTFAAAGLAALIVCLMKTGFTGPAAAGLGILVAAALGGFWAFSARLRGTAPAPALLAVHALAALSGVGIVAYALLAH